MDLQHPSITRTLKEGYPDGTGKPQQTNNIHPNYNRVEEDEQMELEDLTIRELLDMGANMDIWFFYRETKKDVVQLFNDFGINEREHVPEKRRVSSRDINCESLNMYAFYKGDTNE